MLHDVRVLTGEEIDKLLFGREPELIECVQSAYALLAEGQAVAPHSMFLRFEGDSPDRIIALPGYLRGSFETAGIKWISSIPSNHERGIDRASAMIALNDRQTGRVTALLEGSGVSAIRTAAGAALGARYLCRDRRIREVSLVGLGLINFQILRFLLSVFPSLERVHAFDRDARRAFAFERKCAELGRPLRVDRCASVSAALGNAMLVSFATTALTPHVSELPFDKATPPVVLHVSLRDLTPEVILAANNVVDDVEHACRANTSVHLAAERVGHREFMVPLVQAIREPNGAWFVPERATILSPFGLGILDLAVAHFALSLASDAKVGTVIPRFHPPYWTERTAQPT